MHLPNGLFRSVIGIVLGLLIGGSARALEWEKTEIAVVGDPFDESTQVGYRFTNNAAVPVTITSAYSQCGCTVPTLAKKTYGPHETGLLLVAFKFGQVVGQQVKHITVTTDEPAERRTYNLTLEVGIPRLFEMQPALVTWRQGDPLAAKSMTLKIARADVHPTSVDSRDPRLKVSLEADKTAPGSYHLVMTPTDTSQQLWAPVMVKLNLPVKNPRVLIVYAKVLPPALATTR